MWALKAKIKNFTNWFAQFTIKSKEELNQMTSSALKAPKNLTSQYNTNSRCWLSPQTAEEEDLPRVFSWYNKGVITPVKDQYPAGWCAVFTSVAMMETAYQIKTGDKQEFSQQSIGACVNGDIDAGTNIDSIMEHVLRHGVALYQDAPFLNEANKIIFLFRFIVVFYD